MAQVKDQYEYLNNLLMTDIPKLIQMRIAYLDPSFEALVCGQYAYYEKTFKKLNGIENYFDKQVMEGQIEQALLGMRELSICSSS